MLNAMVAHEGSSDSQFSRTNFSQFGRGEPTLARPLLGRVSDDEDDFVSDSSEGGVSSDAESSWKRANKKYVKSVCANLRDVRSGDEMLAQAWIELAIFRKEIFFITFTFLWNFVHSVFTNIVYVIEAELTAAQRVPLNDLGFNMLPELNGSWWIASEYIFVGIISIPIFFAVSNFFIKWRPPHQKPLYIVLVFKRILFNVFCCQCLRIVSFMLTTLPGASRQCLYDIDSMNNSTVFELTHGPANEAGNPEGWAPPDNWHDVLFRIDATNGCGDLMFSSHTIFTMTFVCTLCKYCNWRSIQTLMISLQVVIIPFILAAHKHYSVDIFTALYVTPLVYEILWIRFPDKDSAFHLASRYRVRFRTRKSDGAPCSVVVFNREFPVSFETLPYDMSNKIASGYSALSPSSTVSLSGSDSPFYQSDNDQSSLVVPIVV
uniref:Sphingomyelin synthase-like domain-containing protein n=1 Tax=Leptocylindrus danicus TaxID=163516 RepID=A0A7S2KAV4_9STRA|mmetsp:Transcript_20189/g.30082  ORF Transcript_20189/g.30082 Transcript_20189/m.30082 type:complete len:433 (+) Transcript_20189:159-1457(+)